MIGATLGDLRILYPSAHDETCAYAALCSLELIRQHDSLRVALVHIQELNKKNAELWYASYVAELPEEFPVARSPYYRES